MDYVVKMAVADGIYDGSDGISCFFLGVVLFLDNAVKELASRHKFQNYVEVLLSLEDLEHIDYIWMVNLAVRQPYLSLVFDFITERDVVILAHFISILRSVSYFSIIFTAISSPVAFFTTFRTIPKEPLGE